MRKRPLEFHAAIVRPVLDLSMRGLCTKPYHGHPNGCPNHGQRDTCPPKCRLLGEVFDPNHDIWALWAEFDIAAQAERMLQAHPTWSRRQCVNCRYWQGTVRKFLHAKCWAWRTQTAPPYPKPLMLTTCPEAMGVNVTATMKNIGVSLEWPPKNLTRMVYLVGVEK